ncbi:unnamed protein product [Candidula unifasciata]|uniref:Uncharacterized protein n=1 Tax=Candidula unifasciata TaxID=100452 RepID=A0A8S3ZGE4_9EUPU|nr:unnamed protein product [Candidula unifasciata]
MIGAQYAAASAFFGPPERERPISPPPAISPTTMTKNNFVAGKRNDQSKSPEDTHLRKESRERKFSRSESHCRLPSQLEFCYRISNQSDFSRRYSSQSQNNIADKRNAPSTKQPIKSNVSRSVKNNEAFFASLTMLCSQKNTEGRRFSKSSLSRECAASYDMAMKVILLGDCSVGKTCFLRTLSRVKDEDVTGYCKEFRDGEMADIVFRKDGRRTMVRIIDTGGQERYRSLTSSYYRGIHGCLLVFDVTREDTFNNVMNWYQDLGRYSTDQFVAGILVGTTPPARQRTISSDRGTKLAESLGLEYIECVPSDEVMTSAIVQMLIENVKKVGLRRRSSPVIIKPQMKGNKKSFRASLSQGCVCS